MVMNSCRPWNYEVVILYIYLLLLLISNANHNVLPVRYWSVCLTREILDQTDINLTVHLQLTTDIFMASGKVSGAEQIHVHIIIQQWSIFKEQTIYLRTPRSRSAVRVISREFSIWQKVYQTFKATFHFIWLNKVTIYTLQKITGPEVKYMTSRTWQAAVFVVYSNWASAQFEYFIYLFSYVLVVHINRTNTQPWLYQILGLHFY